jgi:hypothetical protein
MERLGKILPAPDPLNRWFGMNISKRGSGIWAMLPYVDNFCRSTIREPDAMPRSLPRLRATDARRMQRLRGVKKDADTIGNERRTVPADTTRPGRALNDPEALKACIPGCESVERVSTTYRLTMTARVGPSRALGRIVPG